MAVIEWPCGLIRPVDTSFFIKWETRSAGRSLAGDEQFIAAGVGVWQVSITIAPERDPMRARRFEAVASQMRGRLNSALLCICDPFRYGERVSPRQIPHSGGEWHSSGVGFAASGVQPIEVTGAGAAGGTGFFVGLTEPTRPRLRVGDLFTFDGWLHRVVESNNDGWVVVEPPFRRDLRVGTVLETDPPKFRCRFADDREGERSRERLRRGAGITLTFVEDFDR
ncbi:MAG: hypothetical protein Q4G36_08185 [Paracoccus sp. (in: a-proteobacteria)]|nr:hypothetical protein [Paracoccus sp. (in: a-proteobacteria)]